MTREEVDDLIETYSLRITGAIALFHSMERRVAPKVDLDRQLAHVHVMVARRNDLYGLRLTLPTAPDTPPPK